MSMAVQKSRRRALPLSLTLLFILSFTLVLWLSSGAAGPAASLAVAPLLPCGLGYPPAPGCPVPPSPFGPPAYPGSDTAAPVITEAFPAQATYPALNSFGFRFYDADSGVDPATVSLKLDDQPLGMPGLSWRSCGATPTITRCFFEDALGQGTHKISLSVTDRSGNSSTSFAYFCIGECTDPLPLVLPYMPPYIQPVDIRDDATGGDCGVIGVWDPTLKTCRVTHDAMAAITLSSDGITLEGNGYSLTGNRYYDGITLQGRHDVTVKNINISGFQMGITDRSGSRNHFAGNTLNGNVRGIDLHDAVSNVIDGNTVSANADYGISAFMTNGTTLKDNTALNSPIGIYVNDMQPTLKGSSVLGNHYGLYLDGGEPTLKGNTAIDNERGIELFATNHGEIRGNIIGYNTWYGMLIGGYANASSDARVYENNFVENAHQAAAYTWGPYEILTFDGNIFSQPVPVGGNYWYDFNTPGEGCHDTNGDGFCDAAYQAGPGVIDSLPRVTPATGMPALVMQSARPFWASFADYEIRKLTVEWQVDNTGTISAYNIQIVRATNSGGVSLLTPLPQAAGDAAPGTGAKATLAYHIPPGLASFRASISVTGEDARGVVYPFS